MVADILKKVFNVDISADANRLLSIAAILMLTWLVRWVLGGLLPRIVGRIVQRTRTTFDNRLANALLPPLRSLVTIAGVWLIVVTLKLAPDIEDSLLQVLGALVTVTLFWGLFRCVEPVADLFWKVGYRRVQTSSDVLNEQLSRVSQQIARALIVILGFAAVLEQLGQNVSGVIAGVSIAGAAVALAVRETLANLFGYFVILADNPFAIGEYIVFDDTGGTVEAIGFRSTRVRVLDQSLVTVPNDKLVNSNITNWSRLAKRRLNMTLGIEYGSAPEKVLSVVQAIRKMLETHDLVQPDSVIVQFVEFGESSLDIVVICFMNTPAWGDFQAARQDINLKIMNILDERGVEVAFPTRTMLLAKAPEPQERARVEVIPPLEPEPTASTATDSPVPDDAAN
jgi:MscS family membrane protein